MNPGSSSLVILCSTCMSNRSRSGTGLPSPIEETSIAAISCVGTRISNFNLSQEIGSGCRVLDDLDSQIQRLITTEFES